MNTKKLSTFKLIIKVIAAIAHSRAWRDCRQRTRR